VQAWNLGLLELLPDPQRDSYRFQVEARHDATSRDDGQVGIYCLHSKQDTDRARALHCFCRLGFNDILLANPLGLTHGVSLLVERHGEYNPDMSWTSGFGRIDLRRAGEGGAPGQWRQLTVEVTPDRVQAFWAPTKIGDAWPTEKVGAVSRDDLQQHLELMTTGRLGPVSLGVGPEGFDFVGATPDLRARFGARDAIGLFVYRGAASFRHVVVQPLMPPN
jgi:hypothetical protein